MLRCRSKALEWCLIAVVWTPPANQRAEETSSLATSHQPIFRCPPPSDPSTENANFRSTLRILRRLLHLIRSCYTSHRIFAQHGIVVAVGSRGTCRSPYYVAVLFACCLQSSRTVCYLWVTLLITPSRRPLSNSHSSQQSSWVLNSHFYDGSWNPSALPSHLSTETTTNTPQGSAMGIASIALIGGAIVLMFFVVLSGVKDVRPLNKIYFLQADTSRFSGSGRSLSQWTYFYVCGEGNGQCGSPVPALPFGYAWVGGTSGVPSELVG